MSTALGNEIPSITVMQNEIPLEWKQLPAFKGRTVDKTHERAELHPFIGAFEVRHEGTLLYSKLSCRMWPNCKKVAEKVKQYFEEKKKSDFNLNKFNVNYSHPTSKVPGK